MIRVGGKLRALRKLLLVVAGVALLVLLLRWRLFHGPRREPEEVKGTFIVDLHCHTAGLGAGGSGCTVSRRLRSSYKLDIYFAAFGVTRKEIEREGDAIVVDRIAARIRESKSVARAVVLALDGFVDEAGRLDAERTEIYVPNEFVEREVARHPDELLFGASVHPLRADALERLRWAADHGACLIKWIPSIQGIDPSDPRFVPFYRRMVELGLPLLCHTGDERSFTTADNKLADPVRLRLPLELGLTVIAAHAASTGSNDGIDNTDRLIGMMKEFGRLYTDVSSLTQINKLGYLDRVLREPTFVGRMLYGSDYPLIETPLVSSAYFPLHLKLGQMLDLRKIENCFDRDVELKRLLGVPREVFAATAELLHLKRP